MPLVVRFIEPREERYPSSKAGIPRDIHSLPSPENGSPEEYREIDRLFTVTSCLPILESSDNYIQAISVHNIASVIKHLSSLAQHAESIIGGVADGLAGCFSRSSVLEGRVKKLTTELLPSLDSELEAMEGFEIPHPDDQFKSRREPTQLALTRHQPPQPLVDKIQSSHTPALHLLSEVWPNGQNAKQLYTHPGFFFEQWRVSIQKGAFRRKSSAHLLSPTGVRSNGLSDRTRTPLGGAKKIKRSATISGKSGGKASRRKARPISYHSASTLSLQEVGVSASGKAKTVQRTYSIRVSPSYTPIQRKNVKIPKSKHLGDPLSKTIAAIFPQVEVFVTPADKKQELAHDSVKSAPGKLQRGGRLRRSLSLRRSRSKSPNPTPRAGSPDSTISGGTSTASVRGSTTNLATRRPEQLELLRANNAPKSSSTFQSSSSILNRSVAPLVSRVSTPPNGQPGKGWARNNSDRKDSSSLRPPRPQRSVTVSGPSTNLSSVAARVREKIRAEPRPSSVVLENVEIKPSSESPLKQRAASITSLNTSRTPSSLSTTSSGGSRPRSMFVGDMAVGDNPLSQDIAAKLALNSQSRRPRRPAPPRPAGSGGSSTPDSSRKGTTTPTKLNPIPMQSLDTISPPADSKSDTEITPEKGQLESETRPPPPPPQRGDSLSQKPATEASSGSGPATPGTAHTAQAHSSLDNERKQSVAMAINEVLSNINRRASITSPTSPPVRTNGGLKQTESLGKISPKTPTTPTNKGFFGLDTSLNTTVTPFDHSPQFQMSPIDPAVARKSTFGHITPLGKLPPAKRRFHKRGSSLYISPHKMAGFNDRAEEILKAGGVNNGVLEETRSGLLMAIRRGIQLKKVEQEEAAKKGDEVSWDVAAILERYEVLHSDSDEDSEYDDEWIDDFDN